MSRIPLLVAQGQGPKQGPMTLSHPQDPRGQGLTGSSCLGPPVTETLVIFTNTKASPWTGTTVRSGAMEGRELLASPLLAV